MPNTLYNLNSSLSRFNFIKNWVKILFKNDIKLQTTEIVEVQELINNQLGQAFNTLYDFFTITKGCQIIILKISNTEYDCLLTPGQIYVGIKNQYFFIDTPSHNFTINRTQTTFVGINLNTVLSSDEDLFNNPQTGGAAFGSKGADRLILSSSIVVSEFNQNISSYPIALIKPKSLSFVTNNIDISDGAPQIIYYKNEELTEYNDEVNISTYIKNLIELRVFESSGNFISTGLNITVNTSTNVLTISPGIAYINGKRIQTNYNNYFSVGSNITYNKQYLFYITEEATFNYVSQNSTTNLLEVPSNSLALAYVIFNHRNNLLLDYSIIEAPTTMPSVLELINLQTANEDNIKELAELILRANSLNLSSESLNRDLNGIFTDAFIDLNNSDIFFPNYAASILPSIQAISLPFTSNNINNRTFTLDQDNSNIIVESVLNENNELVPYWSTINGSTTKLFNTPENIVGAITIPINENNSIIVKASPSILYKSDANTFVNVAHPNLKKLSKEIKTITVDTPFNNNIYNRAVKIDAIGFNSNQNNIKVEINNTAITSFNLIKGSVGSTTGTLKADQNGFISFTFTIPKLEEALTYNITLSYGNSAGSTQIKIIDPEESRVIKERESKFIDINTSKYTVINGGIAQTFTTTTPTMVKGVECTVMNFPVISDTNLLDVQIVSVDSIGRPVEVLGVGSLSFSEASLLTKEKPTPPPSIINLDKPINLPRGRYAIVFNTSISGIQLGITKAGSPRLLDGKTFYYDPLKTEVLIYRNQWSTSDKIDNIACDLLLHKPQSLLSTTTININANQETPFNIIDINPSFEGDLNSYIDLFILNDENLYENITNGTFFFKKPITSTKLKIVVKGTSNTHPLINLDNLNINLISNINKGVWVSKNQEYETAYNNLTMSVDLYKPNNTTYKFYFSSNKGETWEELLEPVIENVDTTLNINKYTFKKENLNYVVLNSEESLRYNLRYKIEFEVLNNDGIPPFFKNIVSITSA